MVYSPDTDTLFPADNLVMSLRFSPRMDRLRMSKIGKSLSPLINSSAIRILRFQSNPIVDSTKLLIPDHVCAIHGHFSADRFDEIVKQPFKTVILRNPLQRFASHYRYWRMAKGILNERIHIPYNESMSFEEFAIQEPLHNYQTRALGTTDIGCFDVVGISECLEDFIHDFVRKRGNSEIQPPIKLLHLNSSDEFSKLSSKGGEHFIKQFKSYNELDYKIWEKSRSFTHYSS